MSRAVRKTNRGPQSDSARGQSVSRTANSRGTAAAPQHTAPKKHTNYDAMPRQDRYASEKEYNLDRFAEYDEQEVATRLKNRGIAVKRRAKRRRAVALSVFSILAAGLWMLFAFGFKIKKIEVSGNGVYDQSVIRSAFGYTEGDHLFSFRKAQTEQQITESLPYVETVKIRRLPPGNVYIEVTPSVETYYFQLDSGGLITTQNFKVLRGGDNVAGLLQLSGLQLTEYKEGQTVTFADEEQYNSLNAVLKALETTPVEGLTAIDFTDIYEMKLYCNTGIDIALGTYAGLDYKLLLATRAIARLPAGSVGLMDVSGAYSGHKAYFTAGAT